MRGRKPGDFHPDDFRFEVTTSALFSDGDDVADFNSLLDGEYIDGTQYHGLAGDDDVTLANDAAVAAAAGFVPGPLFDAGDGNDIIHTGAGTNPGNFTYDLVYAGQGDDTIYLEAGYVRARGDAGPDTSYSSITTPARRRSPSCMTSAATRAIWST
ncbi:hypothetical protein [Aliiroseovarius subalbicans]|uniref:hypothetical protein n=1 Tax=Aliiroseovarius subalbicans TaxID=2925840 RepID=UPI001F57AE05|nr:hypothetical protein [Aliiroseovarius subalbicans]MCI2400845.1 hypothetical protein [Aliiroseovarius subalbicans]